jgi:hypothetical protein
MTPSEELHLAASGYANGRRDAYLDLMKKGSVEKLSGDMLVRIWLAHYEGYRDALQARGPVPFIRSDERQVRNPFPA